MKATAHKILIVLSLLLALTATGRGAGAALLDAAGCDAVVNEGESIQAAIDAAANGQTICVRGGSYHQLVRVPETKTNLTLAAYPGETPVIDGQRVLPGGLPASRFVALVEIQGPGTVLDGFEIRYSSARGLDIGKAANNAVVRNTSVHDNWRTGILVQGQPNAPSRGVLVENNEVYNNLLKARYTPVIYRGLRSGTGPQDWTFDLDELWNNPFWTGADADLPEDWVNGLSMTFNDDGTTARIYAGTARAARVGYIGAEHSATGAQFSYSGTDILFHEPATNKWTLFFNGDALGATGLPAGAMIDAFQIERPPEPAPCPACTPIVISFAVATTVPIGGTPTVIGPSDLVRFSPTAVDNYGAITAGQFTLDRLASSMVGLPADANIDALDRAPAPDGRLLMSFADNTAVGLLSISNEDLVSYDEAAQTWSLYFDGDKIPFNPFPDDLKAAWLDRNGHIYISGDPIGGSALAFVETEDGVGRGNRVYNNYGEGIIAGRYTRRITLEDNVSYDNQNANLYLDSTTAPLVQRNLIYCTGDRQFWRKGSLTTYRPGNGLFVRDEDFEGQTTMPPASSGQVIINNIVVGCSTNFGVSTQRATGGGGLRDALVANNTFVNARGDAAAGVNNVSFDSEATYIDSRFTNNLIYQTEPGTAVRIMGTRNAFGTLIVAHNLYNTAPPAGWFSGEVGRVVGPPQFAGSAAPPGAGQAPVPANFRLTYASPAFDAGQSTVEVAADFFIQSRAATGAPDIGAHELPYVGTIIVQQVSPARAAQTFDYTADYAPDGFQLRDGQRHDSGPLPAGLHGVTAAPIAGWTTTGECDDGSPPDAIDLAPGETVTCTFSSSQETRLTVVNRLDPATDPQRFDFTLTPGDSFQLGHEQRAFSIAPGTYALAAAVPNGWRQTGATCDNGDDVSAVTLAAGDQVTCTFDHARLGRIVVRKETQPDGAAQRFDFTASYDPDGFNLGDGESDTSAYLPAGSYAVAETLPAGWAQTNATCDDGSTPAAINLAAGETVTCTLVNAQLRLAVTKTPNPTSVVAPGGDVTFSVAVNNTGAAAVTLTTLTDSVYGNVANAANAALKATTCSLPQTVAAGAGYSCTFTATVSGAAGNTHTNQVTAAGQGPNGTPVSAAASASVAIVAPQPGRIIVIKRTVPAGSTQAFTFTPSYGAAFQLRDGQSHDSGLLPPGSYRVSETVPAGWSQTGATCSNGNAPAAITLPAGQTVTCTFTNQRLTSGPEATIYVSTNKAGTVRGVAYAIGDILAYNGRTDTWSLYFDGSDVGVTKTISDFEVLADGSLLMTLNARTPLNSGAARFTLEVQDIARFVPTALGPTTAGAFSLYFDGSDVGMTTSDESIDALARLADGALLISTSGSASVKNGSATLTAKDEDLLAFTATSTGATTAGTWRLHFRGADVSGMTVENLTGASVDPATGTLYATVVNSFTIGGVSGNQLTVLAITPARAVSAYWTASSAGFTNPLDGLYIVR
ncbi:NosD domain-containing protein [Promineifilum sp.]|uniref:prealbumin-like fold domain-containing protein n=1 Tax=Promineifilum sp. TaxID=2664178 RepID=UPI0035AF81D4